MSDSKKLFPKVVKFFENNEFAASTFINKYPLRNKNGDIIEDDPNLVIERVTSCLASNISTKYPTDEWLNKYNNGIKETWKQIFTKAIGKLDRVVPQGSVLSAAGNIDFPQSLSNCFAIPSPHDSIAGIMRSSEQMAQIYKRRGGCGVDLSSLRPSDAPVKNAALTSSGAWGWANHFSNTCRDIAQNGRRGASMQTLHIKHPDSEKWAQMKSDPKYCTGSNTSIWITDEFMEAVKKDKNFKLQFPVDSSEPIFTRTIKARELWNTICKNARENAEPGILFKDNIERNLPAHFYPNYKVCSTNPCSEIPLSAFDACRLATICLPTYVVNKFTKDSFFDFKQFEVDIRIGMRMMDALVTSEIEQIDRIIKKIKADNLILQGSSNVYNVELELWEKVKEACVNGRRCGLGTHGLADCLAQLRIRYDSIQSLTILKDIYKCFRDIAYNESIEMAKDYGPFPDFNWELEQSCDFIQRLPEDIKEGMKNYGRRNISLLTMAPAGTISILSQCSSGIEPTFRQMYLRRRKINSNDSNSRVDFVDELGDKWMNFPQFEKNVERYFKTIGQDLPSVKDDIELQKYLPDYFITSDKIDWKKRVELQGVIQQFIDHSISSTINLPTETTTETVKELYELAWSKGLKGLTIYREGSREGVLISNEELSKKTPKEDLNRRDAPKRPTKLSCEVYVTHVRGIDYVVIVGLYNNSVYEIFCGEYNNQIPKKTFSGFVEKSGKSKYILNYIDDVEVKQIDINKYFDNKNYATATRLLSMSLRHGTPLEYIIDQLQKAGSSMFDFGPAVAKILKKFVKVEDLKKLYSKCSHCNSTDVVLIHENGCFTVKCNSCSIVDSKCN